MGVDNHLGDVHLGDVHLGDVHLGDVRCRDAHGRDVLTEPNAARIYDCLLGGKDHFGVDRRVVEQVVAVAPWAVACARANRAFLARAVASLARAGIRQYVDIGCGLPTVARNVHEIAGRIAPGSRVVYVDNDPAVLAG